MSRPPRSSAPAASGRATEARARPATADSVTAGGAAALAQRYDRVRAATQALAAPLSDEDCALQSMPDASPAKWHLAHTAGSSRPSCSIRSRAATRCSSRRFATLFNSYYHAVGDRHPRHERGLSRGPRWTTIGRYRAHVDAAMRTLLARRLPADTTARIELGLQHEQQHQELILTDVKHLLLPQSAATRVPAGRAIRSASAGEGARHSLAGHSTAASPRSATRRPASPSTTKRRAIAPASRRSRWPRAR